MRFIRAAVTMALAVALVTMGGSPAGADTTDNHYLSNLDGSTAPKKLGFTIFDTGSSRAEIHALPDGVRALVWLGQKCPTRADAVFRRTVDRLAHSARVYGYYLSDEPHVDECPGGPASLATRARYIRRASDGTQRSFIVLDKHNSNYKDYSAFRPQVTRVSLVGLDAYPCNVESDTCEISKINERVNAATKRGFPLRRIVPVYQAFGQEKTSDPYYRLPTAAELGRIVARWAKLVPNPQMDYTYSWGNQGSANPTLKDSEPLQNLLEKYFAS